MELDKARWPKTSAWVERTTATPALAKATRIADKVMQAMPDQHRAILAELGVPLTETHGCRQRTAPGPDDSLSALIFLTHAVGKESFYLSADCLSCPELS